MSGIPTICSSPHQLTLRRSAPGSLSHDLLYGMRSLKWPDVALGLPNRNRRWLRESYGVRKCVKEGIRRPGRRASVRVTMRLFPALLVSHGRVARRMGLGPRSRLDMMRNLVTALVRHERIETTWARADEMRFYADKIIDYGKCGDTNVKAMKMADFWLTEKDLIHKLFKVLVPRFTSHSSSYTNIHQIPKRENLDKAKMAVIEYKGNPFPPLPVTKRDNDRTLINQLLLGYRLEKGLEVLS